MVTHRTPNSFAELQRIKTEEWFDKFGRKDFVRTRYTYTYNQNGRIKDYTTSTITIKGDIQFENNQESKYVQMGIVKLGDAIFYTKSNYDILSNDEITTDGVNYRLVKKIEAEQTNGTTIYQAWTCIRLPEND